MAQRDKAIVPHLSMPLDFTQGQELQVVEQDSTDEILQACMTVLATPRGYRTELPEFGTVSQLFQPGGVSTAVLEEALTQWEDRADVLIETEDDFLEQLVQFVNVYVRPREEA